MTPDANLRADLIHDGLLWHTLYERDGRWWNGYVVARTEREARDKLNPGEELDGQIIAEMPDDGAADHAIAWRTAVLRYLHESPICPYCRRPIND